MYTISPSAHRLLEHLQEWFREETHPPTVRELQAACGYKSPRAVSRHLDSLEEAGLIRREAGKARSLSLAGTAAPPTPPHLVDIPLYGSIPAGYAEESEQQSDACITVDLDSLDLPRHARMFALKVRGDSMIGAHICDGDTVILEFKDPRPGDIVAALIDGETTLKRFLMRRGKPFLKAENPKYPDLIPARELVIQGVLVSLLRHLARGK